MEKSHCSCCVIGGTQLAVDCCKVLLRNGFDIQHLFTDDPLLDDWAQKLDIQKEPTVNFRKTPSSHFEQFDYLFSIVNGVRVPKRILSSIRKLPINYHNGPLPKYAGVNSTHWALINGEKIHGVVWHIMDETFDSGEILVKETIYINAGGKDALSDLNLLCKSAAEKSLGLLCYQLRASLIRPIPQSSHSQTYYYRYDKPSAFCCLPFNCPATATYNFFCGTFCKDPYTNDLGLPKVHLPKPYDKVLVVSDLEVLQHSSNTEHAPPGTVVDISNNIVITTQDMDIMVKGLVELDGTSVKKPFSDSLKQMLNMNLDFPDAHVNHNVWKNGKISKKVSSEFWNLSIQVAKYERRWLKDEEKKSHVAPLSWPYFAFIPLSNPHQDSKKVIYLSLKGVMLDGLLKILADLHVTPQVAVLSSFVNFLLLLSPSFSGSLDVRTKTPSDSTVHSKFLLRYISVSFNFQPDTLPHFKKCTSEIASTIESAFNATVASDVYLRYPIEKPSNLLAIGFAPNKDFNTAEYYSCHHQVSLVSFPDNDEYKIAIVMNHVNLHENKFDTVRGDFLNFLDKALIDEHQQLTTLPLCTPIALEMINKKLTGPFQPINNFWLHRPVEKMAEEFPHVVAIVDEAGCYTYSELLARASQIASWMQEKCSIKVETVVLLLHRTWEVVTSMLAALKLGACFVALEPDFPFHTIKSILEDCKADVIITDSVSIYSEDVIIGFRVCIIDLNAIMYDWESTATLSPVPSNHSNPAFMMYTSGTTGKPKGVQIEHHSICNFIEQVIKTFGLQKAKFNSTASTFENGECSLNSSSHAFDASIHELFPVLWIGGTIIMYPTLPSATSHCSAFLPHVTFLHTQPVKLSLFHASRFKSLQILSYGGEAPTSELIDPWKAKGRTLWNLYGPTEVTVATTFGSDTAMGNPIANTRLRILNPAKQSVPVGIAGELYVGGDGLARGYTKSELNDDVFLKDKADSSRWYRTGDLVCLDANLALHYVGRIPKDRQVKLYSTRIELLGIETVLRQIPGVQFAHVRIEDISKNVKQLAAYIAPETLSAAYIKEVLSKQLPKYNIPSTIISIPRSEVLIGTTGKLVLDRKKYKRLLASSKYKTPNSDIEKTLLKLYQKFLGITDENMFGMSDDFTFYGGTSVTALQLASEINSLLDSNVSPLDIISLRTPEAILHKYRLNLLAKHDYTGHSTQISHKHLPLQFKTKVMSSMQEALLSMNSITLGPTYNIATAVEITGDINHVQLVVAVERVLPLLHEAYNSSSVPKAPSKSHEHLYHVDLSHLPSNKAKFMALQMIQKDAVIPIDLQQCPYRSTLYYISNQSYVLSLIVHHIVFDHDSMTIFLHLVEMCYNNDLIPQASEKEYVPFAEYARTEKEEYKEKKIEVDTFWKGHLKSCKAHVNLPGIVSCLHTPAYIGKRYTKKLDEKLSMRVAQASEALSVQPNSYFLSVFGLLIAKLSGDSFFGIGVNISRRNTRRLEKVIGFVANTVIRCFSEEELFSPFAELLQTTENWLYEASKYSSIPFLELSKLFLPVDVHRDPYHIPQFLFHYLHDMEPTVFKLGAKATVNHLEILETFTAKSELELSVLSKGHYFICQWEYNSSLFSPEAAAYIADMYIELLSIGVCNTHKSGLILTTSLDLALLQYTAQQELCFSTVGSETAVDFSHCQKTAYHELSGLPIDCCAHFHGLLTLEMGENVAINKVKLALQNMQPKLQFRVSVEEGKPNLLPMKEMYIPIFEETAKSEADANAIILRQEHWPFDIFKGPLFRVTLLHHAYSRQTSWLVVVFHQLLMDKESGQVFAQQLNKIIATGVQCTNPQTNISVHIPSGQADLHMDYWMEKLGQTCKPMSLSTHSVSGVSLLFSRLLQSAVIKEHFNSKSLCGDHAIISASFASLLLCHLQQCTNILFGIVLSCTSSDTITPVSIQVDPNTSIQTFLTTVDKSLKESQLHTPFSYWQFQEQLDSFATYVSPYIETVVEVDVSNTKEIAFYYHQPFKIIIHFNFAANTVVLRTCLSPLQTYVTQDCFRKLLQHFLSILNGTSEALLPQLETVSLSQLDTCTSLGHPPRSCLELSDMCLANMLFGEANECMFGHSVAYSVVSSIPCHVTHQEAWQQSHSLASVIRGAANVSMCEDQKSSTVLGVLTSGGLELPIAVMASLLAGYPFCILDPTDGKRRLLEKICTSSMPNFILLCDAEAGEMAMEMSTSASNITAIISFSMWLKPSLIFSGVGNDSVHIPDLDDCTYIVFTSGSTGKPKTVPVQSKSLINFLIWIESSVFKSDALNFRWLQYSGLSFDGCVLDMLIPWLCGKNSGIKNDSPVSCGSTLFLLDSSHHPNPKLDFLYALKCIKQCSIECIFSVPTIIKQLLKLSSFASNTFPHLKHVISIGEELKYDICSTFFQHFPPKFSSVELHNWYGPAECCIAVTNSNVNKQTHFSSVEVGNPVFNAKVLIVSPESKQVPQGFPGEIVIEGLPVFNGYLSDLAPKVGQAVSPNYCYYTGDVGYINTHNQLVWLQRYDRQVKVSGERIELDEVCAKIRSCSLPYITDVIVDTFESESHPKSLVCYLEVTDDNKFTRDRAQADLSQILPKRFVPTVVKCMKEFPKLLSHKVDRKYLKELVTVQALPSLHDETVNRHHSLEEIMMVLLGCLSETIPSVHFSNSHLELPLDMLGLSSVLKAKFWQLLHDKNFPVTMTSILTCRNMFDLAIKVQHERNEGFSYGLQQSSSLVHSHDDIAIVSFELNVPGATSCEQFWKVIIEQQETIRHNLSLGLNHKIDEVKGSYYVGSRGLITNKDQFDASLFGIEPNHAKLMDPQQRLLLQCVWSALEKAGYDPHKFADQIKIGCFVGVHFPSYFLHNVWNTGAAVESGFLQEYEIMVECLGESIALHLGQYLDCRGPCIFVSHTCSTFSAALHYARLSLQEKECDIAVVAGASVSTFDDGYMHTENGIFSSDGHCRPFSQSATGTVFSDGLVVSVLRRLSDAELQHDEIMCVIKASAVGSDGSQSQSRKYAPSKQGQVQTLKQVFESSGISPNSISLVEAHGTGTKIGDAIELESLKSVFEDVSNSNQCCVLGSVKGNIGHTEAASAGCSIVKVALALKHSVLPPTIHCEDPLSSLENSPFCILQEPKLWISSNKSPRRALVHSIGIKGANSAVILEEYINPHVEKYYHHDAYQSTDDISYPLCISAGSKWSLHTLSERFIYSCTQNCYSAKDVAYTVAVSRKNLSHRAGAAVKSEQEVIHFLNDIMSQQVIQQVPNREICILFGPQGSKLDLKCFQQFYHYSSSFRKTVKAAFKFLQVTFPEDVSSLNSLLQDGKEDTAKSLLERHPIQAVLAVICEVGIYTFLQEECGLKERLVVGHSLGEYTAACIAGAFTFEEVLAIVFKRGLLVEQYVPHGRMLLVRCSGQHVISRYLHQQKYSSLKVSCFNSPVHSVVSGPPQQIQSLKSEVERDSIKCRLLEIPYAYHHPSMKMVQHRLEKFLQKITPKSLQKKIITTLSNEGSERIFECGSKIPHQYWIKHLTMPVDFLSSLNQVEESLRSLPHALIEVGTTAQLKSLVNKIDPQASLHYVALTCSKPSDSPHKPFNHYTVLALTELWKLGVDLQLHKLSTFADAKHVPLPTYPFECQKYWIHPSPNTLSDQFLTPHVQPKELSSYADSQQTVEANLRKWAGHASTITKELPIESHKIVYFTNQVLDKYGVNIDQLVEEGSSIENIAVYVHDHIPKSKSALSQAQVKIELLSKSVDKTKPAMFIINAVGHHVKLYSFLPLATLLQQYFQVYALNTPVPLVSSCVQDIAKIYLEEISKLQTEGPYVIGGFSFGGWIAHCISSLLAKKEQASSFLMMIDPLPLTEDTLPSIQDLPHQFQCLLNTGKEYIDTLADSPHELICDYAQRFKKQLQLLHHYKINSVAVHCPTTILLASDGPSKTHIMKLKKPETWAQWFNSKKLNVMEIPGGHATCIAALNCHHVVKALYPKLRTEIPDGIPIRLKYDILGEWKLKSLSLSGELCENIKLNEKQLQVQGYLVFSTDGHYTCMVPHLFQTELDTLKLPRNNLDWLNSSGTFALQQDAGKVELSAVMSFSNREVVVFFNVFVQAFNHSVHITLRNEFVHSIWTRLSGQH